MIFGFSGGLLGSVARLFGAAEELLLVSGTVATLGSAAPAGRKARRVAGFGAALLGLGLLG